MSRRFGFFFNWTSHYVDWLGLPDVGLHVRLHGNVQNWTICFPGSPHLAVPFLLSGMTLSTVYVIRDKGPRD